MDDVHNNNDFNSLKSKKYLIVFDGIIADIYTNKIF